MTEQQALLDRAIALVDAANSEDPNQVTLDGKDWPKELLYSQRMSDMLQRFRPDADAAQQLAIRAQHVQRWKSPRDAYPMDRIGYLQWRKDLYKIQAETAVGLLEQAGYGEDVTGRSAFIDDPADRDRGAVSLEQVLWFVAAGVSVVVIATILWNQIRDQANTPVDPPVAPTP